MSGRGHYSDGIAIEHDAMIAVGAGKVPTADFFNINARRSVLSTTGLTPLIDFADTYTFPPETGEAITAVSASAADVDNVIEVIGLDENKLYKREVVVLAGTTPVPLPGLWSRVNAANTLVKEVQGEVTIAGTNTYAVISVDLQRSSLGVYSSPDNMSSQVLRVIPSIIKTGGTAAYVNGGIKFRSARAGGAVGAFSTPFTYGLRTDGTSFSDLTNTIPAALEGSADYVVEAEATANNVRHYVRANILLQELKK